MRVRKVCRLLIGVLLITLLCACSNDMPNEPTKEILKLDFVEYMGNDLDQTRKKMSIKESDLQKSKLRGRYDFLEKVSYKNIEFTKYLVFEGKENTIVSLYGGGYESKLSKNNEKLLEVITSLRKELCDEYGSPTTYPGTKNTIGDHTDFSKFSNESLHEEWTDESNGCIALRMIFLGDDVIIQLEYRNV